MTDEMTVFDRQLVRARRDRAAANFDNFDFLFREVADRLADRLLDIVRVFPIALELGCHTGVLKRILTDRGKIEMLIQCDISEQMAHKAEGLTVVADEEALPFEHPVGPHPREYVQKALLGRDHMRPCVVVCPLHC